jgi:hypothetical protein
VAFEVVLQMQQQVATTATCWLVLLHSCRQSSRAGFHVWWLQAAAL